MRKSLVVLTLLAGLAGCQTETPPPAGAALTEAERVDCLEHGGKLGRGGMLGNEICYRATPDAGKSCKKASDCSGACMADTMSCSKLSPQFGCFEMMTDDGQKVGLCVD